MAVYAVGFDGTLAETRFPEIIGPKRKMITGVKLLRAAGHKIILWTCRAGEDLEAAVEWCRAQGLEFDAVNGELPGQLAGWGDGARKIHADFYIDDRAMPQAQIEGLVDRAVEAVGRYGTRR